jgi:predicted DsbA family dithiol-disulfide isomerase
MPTVDHWFDFICPYCYIAQDRNQILREHGVDVVEHACRIHPEIGPGGVHVGARVGPNYDFLADEAKAAGLPLHWTDRIAYSRPALAAFSWLKTHHPEEADRFSAAVFSAYFAERLDIESHDLLVSLAGSADLRPALTSGAADAELLRSATSVTGTPTWIADGVAVSGLRPRGWFENWAASLVV